MDTFSTVVSLKRQYSEPLSLHANSTFDFFLIPVTCHISYRLLCQFADILLSRLMLCPREFRQNSIYDEN